MLRHFTNLFGQNGDDESNTPRKNAVAAEKDEAALHPPEETKTAPIGDFPAEVPPAELSAEMEELDTLYRQALQTMDMVEEGCHLAAEEVGQMADAVPATAENAPSSAEFLLPDGPQHVEPADEKPENREAVFGRQPPSRLTPQQVLEAALFVGGIDLTLKRLCGLLHDEFSPERIEGFIEELNEKYAAQERPYEIRFGEGGYRMQLRSDFDDVRNRVFGMGPKEIKLSPDALEVLSLVAYQQPVPAERISELRGSNASSILRQLLRRRLIALERSGEERQTIFYRTTPRFLQVFGLGSLDDLPQSDDLSFK